MTVPEVPDGRLRIAASHRLQWEEAQQCFVLLYPEGMVTLNPSAAEVLKRCDGSRDFKQVIADLQTQFPDAEGLEADVGDFVMEALQRGWIHAE